MPSRSSKPCKKIGCSNLVKYPHKYCEQHMQLEFEENAERNSFYDKNIRDKKRDEFYHSKEWTNIRQYILNKYKGLDLFDYYINNKITYASTVHHIIELKDDWDKRIEILNLLPVSESTHNIIHAMYEKNKIQTQKLLFDLIKKWIIEMG